MFETIRFLEDHFGDVDGVLGLIAKHWGDVPRREAVRKWFSRQQVPSEWWPVLLFVLEKENRGPIALSPYVHPGGGNDVFD